MSEAARSRRARATYVARDVKVKQKTSSESGAASRVTVIPDGEAGLRLLDALERVARETGLLDKEASA